MSEATQKKILILSADPKGTNHLRLEQEKRDIKEGLRRSGNRDLYSIETAEAVRYNDIHRAMLDYKPNIVHFSGHGKGQAGLVFEDETGLPKLVDGESIAELFKLFASEYKVECIVLNACYSEVQAQAIARHINCVIGMSDAMEDRAAIQFAIGFYDALGAGKSYEFAYKLGCAVIGVAGIQQNLVPKLLTKQDSFAQSPDLKSPSSNKSDKVELLSAVGADYTTLKFLLSTHKWQQADLETFRIMLEVAGRGTKQWFNRQSMERFPGEDLLTIDRLWTHYSKGKFGFSVQKRIYQSLGGTGDVQDIIWLNFLDRIGWRKERDLGERLINIFSYNNVGGDKESKTYEELTFSIHAPAGHLPGRVFFRFGNMSNLFNAMLDTTAFEDSCVGILLTRKEL